MEIKLCWSDLMELLTPIMFGLLVLVLIAVVLLFWRIAAMEKSREVPAEPQSLLLMQQHLSQLQKDVNSRLLETHQTFKDQHQSVTGIVRDVSERMAKMEEISRQVLNETNELQKLQQILRNPKQRGILGEYFLETLLKNVLPPESYQMQYKFADGEIVDAALFVKDRIVPVDSKFSLENYNRLSATEDTSERERLEKLFVNDLKTRVQETSKYIRPNEGTMEFAFMFIPHEAIYYDLLVNKIGNVTEDTENIIQRAASKYHVIVVSPTSFLAYLQTVLQGLRAMQIEETAKDVILRVGELGRHLAAYEKHYRSIGNNLETVVNQYNLGYKEFAKIDKDVLRVTGEPIGVQSLGLEPPTAHREN